MHQSCPCVRVWEAKQQQKECRSFFPFQAAQARVYMYICTCIYIHVYVYVCVCVCMVETAERKKTKKHGAIRATAPSGMCDDSLILIFSFFQISSAIFLFCSCAPSAPSAPPLALAGTDNFLSFDYAYPVCVSSPLFPVVLWVFVCLTGFCLADCVSGVIVEFFFVLFSHTDRLPLCACVCVC